MNNKLSNFERLSFTYLPSSMKEFEEANLMARQELLETARMLQVEGIPSRASIIHQITVENINANVSQPVYDLFELIENEKSPLVISRKGRAALDTLCKESPELARYRAFIAKTLSVRIL